MTDAMPPPEIRLSDADRGQAADRLQRAFAEGRITVTEFEERTAATYAARVGSDLVPLLADLPPEPIDPATRPYSITHHPAAPPATASPAAGAVDGRISPATAASPGPSPDGPRPLAAAQPQWANETFPPAPEVIRDAGMWRTTKRKGQWVVPGWLVLRIGRGAITLDCREARFAQQITAIDVDLGLGAIKILLPDGVSADVSGVDVTAQSATTTSTVPAIPLAGYPHLVISGRIATGKLVVRRGIR